MSSNHSPSGPSSDIPVPLADRLVDLRRPKGVDSQRWLAIQQHASRVVNQIPGDHGGMIGACKDLVECVAKVVLTEATSPVSDDFPRVVKKASSILGQAASDFGGGSSAATTAKGLAQAVNQAASTSAQGLAELRNEHGSGHGRTAPADVSPEDTELILSYTVGWTVWALARLERLLANQVSTLIAELSDSIFHKGVLRSRFSAVGLDTLGEEEQERLGFAVAERGARRQTVVVARDGLDPLIEIGKWPIAYQYGVAKGLLLTAEGTLRPVRTDVLAAVVPRLGFDLIERLLDDLEGTIATHMIDDESASQWMTLNSIGSRLPGKLGSRWQSAVVDPYLPF